MGRRTFFTFAATLLALAGCAGAPQRAAPEYPAQSVLRPQLRPGVQPTLAPQQPGRPPVVEQDLSTTAPAGRKVVLLAPLTGANAERGQALAAAARLALSAAGSPELEVIDTRSTAEGATSGAERAIAGGAGMIIGPLTTAETAAAAGPATAAGIPMLAFTNDEAQARPGVWTLGLTPVQQVRRLVGVLGAQGKTRIAAVLAQDAFGNAMAAALTETMGEAGLPPPVVRFHTGNMQSANAVMREISEFGSRRGPIEAQIKAARALGTPEGRRRAAELQRHTIPPPPMDALLLSDFGDGLRTLASLLPFYDLDPPAVRILGPAQWAVPQVLGDAELRGAWYAAPDAALRADFSTRFAAATGAGAPGIADFAYDAASIARVLVASGEGYSMAALCRPEGFAGVSGVLALHGSGRVRRGLAVFEVQRGGATMIEASPATIAAPGI